MAVYGNNYEFVYIKKIMYIVYGCEEAVGRVERKVRAFCDFNAIHSLKAITHSFICMFVLFYKGV